MKSKFFVFGKGELLAVYDKAGYAVQHADEVEGVVVSSRQSYVWERGNRDLRHQIEGLEGLKKADGESALDACIRGVLKKEGKIVDVKAESKKGKSTMNILTEFTKGEGIDLTGCTLEEMCYLIGKDTPVIAMTSSSDAVLLVGYSDTMITYIDPTDGKTHTENIETLEKKVKGSGNTFIGYNY